MGLIGRGGPAPRRRARSLEAGLLLLRLRAAHARTRPHAGKWGGGGSPSLPCVAPCARVSRAGAHMRMDGDGAPRRRARRVPHGPTCSCARGNQRRRGWLAGCLDADLPQAACQRGRDGLRPWVCRRPASCGCGGGGSWLGGARGWLLGTGALVRWRWRAELALRSRCARAALAPRYTHAGLRGAGAVGSPRRRRQLPLLISPLLLSLCRHHSCQFSRARSRCRARSLARA